ncbi:MAG: aldolase/citrate lyase family protein [Planctomycetota bacterium]|nr:aldolase/citrate lyase family protein [Planctomycetota bacterium]
MRTNRVKAALKAGQVVLGSEVSGLHSAEVPRLFAEAGLDFAFIDMEHSSMGLETVAELVHSARQAGITPIVRVPQAEYPWVARVLDNGALGIIVPRVNTEEEARQIVSWTRYPPRGIRGFACTRAQSEGEPISPRDYIEWVDAETLVVIQIERREAMENLEAMLSVPGVDVACMGLMDLSTDLGIPGEIDHPEMIAAVDRVVEVSRARGIAAGIITADMRAIQFWIGRGMRFVSYSTDFLLLKDAASRACRQMRDTPTGR